MSNIALALYVSFLVLVTVLAVYSTIAWYSYPCEAFKSGWLSTGYAPARCIH